MKIFIKFIPLKRYSPFSLCQFSSFTSGFNSSNTLTSSSSPSSSSSSSSSTLHEESAGGLNGRFARLSQSSSPSELLSFYSRLGPADRSQLNIDSFNYILLALFRSGQQIEAFKLISRLEEEGAAKNTTNYKAFPDRTSFNVIMEGLVEADNSGSLALAVDEIFNLMQEKYKIRADLQSWSSRIRAFLHAKYMSSSSSSSSLSSALLTEASRVFYREMLNELGPKLSIFALNELRADLVVTAVNRKLWSFSEWILFEELNEMKRYDIISAIASNNNTSNTSNDGTFDKDHQFRNLQFSLTWDKIANAAGLFHETASVPILRHLLHQTMPSDSIIKSVGFNQQVLLFAWRQGRLAADLASLALENLMKLPQTSRTIRNFWLSTADECLRRDMPRDFHVFDGDEGRERSISVMQRVKCDPKAVKELEETLINYKLLPS